MINNIKPSSLPLVLCKKNRMQGVDHYSSHRQNHRIILSNLIFSRMKKPQSTTDLEKNKIETTDITVSQVCSSIRL